MYYCFTFLFAVGLLVSESIQCSGSGWTESFLRNFEELARFDFILLLFSLIKSGCISVVLNWSALLIREALVV